MGIQDQKINTVQAKNQFNALVATANKTKTPIIVEKRGHPIAVILDYESYRQTIPQNKSGEPDKFMEELFAWHKYLKKNFPGETVDSAEIIRKLRQERAKKYE